MTAKQTAETFELVQQLVAGAQEGESFRSPDEPPPPSADGSWGQREPLPDEELLSCAELPHLALTRIEPLLWGWKRSLGAAELSAEELLERLGVEPRDLLSIAAQDRLAQAFAERPARTLPAYFEHLMLAAGAAEMLERFRERA